MKTFFCVIAISLISLLSKEVTAKSSMESSLCTLSDTIVFDLEQAIISTVNSETFIEIPISIKSFDPEINAVDYWFQFDLNKLTYVSTVSLVPSLDVFSFFNTNNLYLSNTSSTSSLSVFLPLNEPIMNIRFSLNDPCAEVLNTDFFNNNALLNGIVSISEFVNPENGAIPPITIETPSPFCDGSVIEFSYPSVINDQTITSYEWDFDNGQTGDSQLESTVFNNAGMYYVSLDVLTENGCQKTVTTNVEIFPRPQVNFSSTYNPITNSFSFFNLSSIIDGWNQNYVWDLGDATTSNLFQPTHSYGFPGIYDVTLTATSDQGCVNSFTNSVDAPVSIEESDKNEIQLHLFPNPAVNSITLESTETIQFFIIDRIGKRVTEDRILFGNTQVLVAIDHLAEGIYTVVGYNDQRMTHNSFMVVR